MSGSMEAAAVVEPATPTAVIDRISLVLDAFEGPGRLTLAQIVRRTGLPRSSAHRMLERLVQLRWLDLHTDLAEGLLTKVDRTSMAHSLEVRPPLLDHRLVEFMLSVDPALLVDERRRRGKLLVRRLMEPRLPDGHLDRPKSGFGLPVHRWLKNHPRLLREAVERLRVRGVLRRPVGTEFRRAWSLLVLDRWFTAFA